MAVASIAARDASAAACTLPSDCFNVGQVCHLGVCAPCESNFDDAGTSDPLFGCQDPSHPICDKPDGSLGGACVECTTNTDCHGGATCDQGTNTCVGGDAGAGDGGGPGGDGGLPGGDGGLPGGDGGFPGGDGGFPGGDGGLPSGDGGFPGGEGGLPSGDGGFPGGEGGALDGAFVEGGGCACETVEGGASLGGLFLSLGLVLAAVARRRSR